MRRLMTLTAAALTLIAGPAAADVAAIWSIDGQGELRLYARDAGTFLADPQGPGALLMRDARLWVLTDDGGLRASRTWNEIERPEAAVAALTESPNGPALEAVERTQARETVEGVSGMVWTATEMAGGHPIAREAVLSPDARLALATTALARLGEAIAPYRLVQGVPLREVAAEAADRDLGLLRYGDVLRLRHLETATFSEHAYDTEPQAARRPYDTYDFNGDAGPLPEGDDRPAVN